VKRLMGMCHSSLWLLAGLLSLVAVAAVIAVITSLGRATHLTSTSRPAASSSSCANPTTPPTGSVCAPWAKGTSSATGGGTGPITSAPSALARLMSTPGVASATKSAASESTWQSYQTLSSTGLTKVSPTVMPPNTAVWVACATASATAPFAAPGTSQSYSWVCEVFNASNGTELSRIEGQSDWPSWFSKLAPVSSP
jgi:hypothetical protein